MPLTLLLIIFSIGCTKNVIILDEEQKEEAAKITEEMLIAFNDGNYKSFPSIFQGR